MGGWVRGWVVGGWWWVGRLVGICAHTCAYGMCAPACDGCESPFTHTRARAHTRPAKTTVHAPHARPPCLTPTRPSSPLSPPTPVQLVVHRGHVRQCRAGRGRRRLRHNDHRLVHPRKGFAAGFRSFPRHFQICLPPPRPTPSQHHMLPSHPDHAPHCLLSMALSWTFLHPGPPLDRSLHFTLRASQSVCQTR